VENAYREESEKRAGPRPRKGAMTRFAGQNSVRRKMAFRKKKKKDSTRRLQAVELAEKRSLWSRNRKTTTR